MKVIEISRDAALILFDLLSRAGADRIVRPDDAADHRVLSDLEAMLEQQLPEVLLPKYTELLEAARQRLRPVEAQTGTHSARPIAYVDVDDTLVRSFGSKRIPMTAMIDHVRQLHAAGALLYCWSAGGAEYAKRSAQEFGIEHCFVGFLPKPSIMIDDQAPADWRSLVCVHPNTAVSMNLEDYLKATSLGK